MRFLLALIVLLTWTASAWSAPGGAGVQVTTHAGEQGLGVVRARIEIAAPAEVVFRTLLDCDRANRIMPGVRRCRVVSADPAGEIREHVVKWSFFLPALHSTARVSVEPDRLIRFTCIGGDIRACEGSWRLTPLDGGRRTQVDYDMWATAPFGLPAGLIGGMMRRDAPAALDALRRECEQR